MFLGFQNGTVMNTVILIQVCYYIRDKILDPFYYLYIHVVLDLWYNEWNTYLSVYIENTLANGRYSTTVDVYSMDWSIPKQLLRTWGGIVNFIAQYWLGHYRSTLV